MTTFMKAIKQLCDQSTVVDGIQLNSSKKQKVKLFSKPQDYNDLRHKFDVLVWSSRRVIQRLLGEEVAQLQCINQFYTANEIEQVFESLVLKVKQAELMTRSQSMLQSLYCQQIAQQQQRNNYCLQQYVKLLQDQKYQLQQQKYKLLDQNQTLCEQKNKLKQKNCKLIEQICKLSAKTQQLQYQNQQLRNDNVSAQRQLQLYKNQQLKSRVVSDCIYKPEENQRPRSISAATGLQLLRKGFQVGDDLLALLQRVRSGQSQVHQIDSQLKSIMLRHS